MTRRMAMNVGRLVIVVGAMAAVVGCPSGGPALSVYPMAVSFPAGLERNTLSVTNTGTGTLSWTVNQTPAWIDVESGASGSVTTGMGTVTLHALRDSLAPGTYSGDIVVTSNAGTRTVGVSLTVAAPTTPPELAVDPAALTFEADVTEQTLTIRNEGGSALSWSVTTPPWLTCTPASNASTTTEYAVVVQANRAGLVADVAGAIQIASNGGNLDVPVTLVVEGADPILDVEPLNPSAPNTIDFGTTQNTSTVRLRNIGAGSLNWQVSSKPDWITAQPSLGTGVTTAATDVVLTVRRDLLAAAGTYTSDIVFAGTNAGTQDSVSVQVTVAPSSLVVQPTELNYRSYATDKLLAITNGGAGSVDWSIDTSGFPAWLSLDNTSGTVVSGQNDVVLVSVNRDALVGGEELPPGAYSYEFSVTGEDGGGSPLTPVTVRVSMIKPTAPALEVISGMLGDNNLPLVTPEGYPHLKFGGNETTATFTIRNGGTGILEWNIDDSLFPAWLTMNTVQGSVTTGETVVTATVSRREVDGEGDVYPALVHSNGGVVPLVVTVVVDKRPVIGVDPTKISFSAVARTAELYVANLGDPDTTLYFEVTKDRNWMLVSPTRGESVGTAGPIKDWRQVNVTVDRSMLNGIGDTGTITVTALAPDGAPIDGMDPIEIDVSVSVPYLSFESSIVRKRVPSLLRQVFLMRDVFDNSFVIAPEAYPDAFTLLEMGEPIEGTETEPTVRLQKSVLTDGISEMRTELRTNVVFLLDYSASMVEAAALALPGSATPLQEFYAGDPAVRGDGAVGGTIAELFDMFGNAERGLFSVALMEFHDRNLSPTLVHGFTNNEASLQAALDGISIADHGATELLPAVEAAASYLWDKDENVFAYDDADIRAIALFSDGRLTTPPGVINETTDALLGVKVRVFSVSWGHDPNHEPMARLGFNTGGHFYNALREDAFATVEKVLERGQLMARELASHMVLQYPTLNESENATIRWNGGFDLPDDDQAKITGSSAEQNVNLLEVVGDTSLGQISMRSTGVSGGAATVTIRADYIPRNISQIRLTVAATSAFTATTVDTADSGLHGNWNPNIGGAGGVFTLISDDGFLPYGSYGDLLRLSFAAPAPPVTVTLAVDNSLYPNPDGKYFIYPDRMTFGGSPFLAPAFPTPFVEPESLDFGDSESDQSFDIANIGGYFAYQPGMEYLQNGEVRLNWDVLEKPEYIATVTPDEGFSRFVNDFTPVTVSFDRDYTEGTYSSYLILSWNAGLVNAGGLIFLGVNGTILPPVLTVNPASLNFLAEQEQKTLSVSNTGQSTLSWTLVDNLPGWLITSSDSGQLAFSEPQEVISVRVDRTGLAPGDYAANLIFHAVGASGQALASRQVSVTMAAAPLLAVSRSSIDFGSTSSSQAFYISNEGVGSFDWEVQGMPAWLSAQPATGTIADEEDEAYVVLTANRDLAVAGLNTATLTIATGDGQTESVYITLLK